MKTGREWPRLPLLNRYELSVDQDAAHADDRVNRESDIAWRDGLFELAVESAVLDRDLIPATQIGCHTVPLFVGKAIAFAPIATRTAGNEIADLIAQRAILAIKVIAMGTS